MNICFFYGQGNINFNFDKYADPYFCKVEKLLGISKTSLIKEKYIYKYQLLSLIFNISFIFKLSSKIHFLTLKPRKISTQNPKFPQFL